MLLDAARGGDSRAVERLYTRYHGAALRIASRYASHDYPAQDLASEAFTALLRALSRGQGPKDAPLGYVMVSMRNLAAGHARRMSHPHAPHSAAEETMQGVPDPAPGVDEGLLPEERGRDVGLRWQGCSPTGGAS